MGLQLTRSRATLAILLLLTPLGVTGTADEGLCPAPRQDPNVGLVCDEPNGLMRVVGPNGEDLGTTHGHDPAPMEDPVLLSGPSAAAAPAPIDPFCVEIDSTPYVAKVIYATAFDGPNNYQGRVDDVRWMVRQSTGVLRQEAQEFGVPLLYRVGCTNGVIAVAQAVLATPNAARSFSTVVSDLKDLGYDEYGTHYWIFYDQPSCGGGVGHIYGNDSPSVTNQHNGNAPAMFAVTFGCTGASAAHVMMHELGHNMGAVQQTSPNTSGSGWHCNDGDDVMCYADGGSQSNYDPNVCTDREHFDCNHDDYFHPAPPPGSYLATHWNLASEVNRFIEREIPIMELLECEPDMLGPGEPTTCEFMASDGGTEIHYELDWGDGSTVREPASGTVAPGVVRSATHSFAEPADYTVQVTAFAGDGTTSQAATRTIRVEVCDMDESGPLTVGVAHTGLHYVTIARTDLTAHPKCPGEPFTLTAESSLDDFDVCFYDFNIELACHNTIGPEAGIIPAGTDRISILYQFGFDGTWVFKAGEAVGS